MSTATLASQTAFRGLLDAAARPGTTVDLIQPATRVAGTLGESDTHAGLLLLAVTLLDAGTPCHVTGPDATSVVRLIRRHTYAPEVALEDARFVICTAPSAARAAAKGANPGTLERPDLGATVIVSVDALSGPLASEDTGATHTLTGPGIDGHHHVQVDADGDVLAGRDAHAGTYPQGIDMLLITSPGVVMALPRTTVATHLNAGNGRHA